MVSEKSKIVRLIDPGNFYDMVGNLMDYCNAQIRKNDWNSNVLMALSVELFIQIAVINFILENASLRVLKKNLSPIFILMETQIIETIRVYKKKNKTRKKL